MSCRFCEKIWASIREYETQLKYGDETPAIVSGRKLTEEEDEI